MPNFWALKIPSNKNIQQTSLAKLRSWNTRAQTRIFRLFWVPPKNPYLNEATPKKYWNRKFQTQKILWSSPSLEIRSTPPETQPDQKQSKIPLHLTVYTSGNNTFTFYMEVTLTTIKADSPNVWERPCWSQM